VSGSDLRQKLHGRKPSWSATGLSSSTLYTSEICVLPGAALGEAATRSIGGDEGEFGEFDPDDLSFRSLNEFVPFTVADIVAAEEAR
jgi:hypothetical protein